LKQNVNFTPVIFGGYVNGYSLARTFYETYKVKSIICDTVRNVAYYSKFCDYIIVENPNRNIELFLDNIKSIGEKIRKKIRIPILLVTNDIWLIPLAKYKLELENIFLYSFSGWDIIGKFVNKDKLYEQSHLLGVPYPKSLYITSNNDIDIQQLDSPFLVKPADVNEYSYSFPKQKRNFIFETVEDVFAHLKSIYLSNYKGGFIIQEYIPGGTENLYTCSSYSDSTGKIKAVSTGCKLSQSPAEAGTITSGLVKYNDEIIELTKKLLESNNFFGIANTEFKYDKRNNTYKLIEVNARPGMWNYSVFLSGVNLIEYLVNDVIYNRPLLYSESSKSLIWTMLPKREILEKIKTYDNKLIVKKLLKEGEIYNPLRNKKDGFVFNFRYYYALIKKCIKHILWCFIK